MADATTTLSVSKKFHEWLKSKGSKGENYEDIIKKLLRPEFVKEAGSSTAAMVVSPRNERSAPDIQRSSKKKPKLNIGARTIDRMPKQKEVKSPKKAKTASTPKTNAKSSTRKTGSVNTNAGNEKLKQSSYEENLELQGLNIELELAKLSNNAAKVKELSDSIARLKDHTG